jgi:hypothetical protein
LTLPLAEALAMRVHFLNRAVVALKKIQADRRAIFQCWKYFGSRLQEITSNPNYDGKETLSLQRALSRTVLMRPNGAVGF